MSTSLISAARLQQQIETNDLLLFDASWYMPATERDTRMEYLHGHLPGAQFFDIDSLSSHSSDLPHMLPEKADFEQRLRQLGLKQGQPVVVYDTAGIFSAPRAWWMLKVFGITDVSVLEGGLPAWLAAGGSVETGLPSVAVGDVVLELASNQVSDINDIARYVQSGDRQIIDARSVDRFTGVAPDPRVGVAPGHIPGSYNIPFGQLLTATGHLREGAALREVFTAAGVDLSRPITASCGSGVTAAIVILALSQLKHHDLTLYDGSWAEWGALSHMEKATGRS